MTDRRSPFDWSGAELNEAVQILGHALAHWWDQIPSLDPAGRAHDVGTHSVRPDWGSPFQDRLPPETGRPWSELLPETLKALGRDDQIVGHPGYLAYVAGAANPIAPLAQALAMALNPYTGTYTTAPAAVALEDQTLRWLAHMVHWPESSAGWLTTGSSLAILSAVIAAREARRAPAGQRRIYVSDQAHHCIGKALFAAGFQAEETCVIKSVEGRLDADQVREQIRQDKHKGRTPVLLVGTAGTTNTGRVDPLRALARLSQEEDLWFHIDAAYGGFFRLLHEAEILQGMEDGDSLSLDPHKALCMPYGTGALLVKQAHHLRWPRGLASSYMPPYDEAHLRLEYSDISPELSRDFRGLRLWLTLKVFGLEAFRRHLRSKWEQARWLAQALEEDSRLHLVAAPDLSILAWRVAGDGQEGTETKRLLQAINSSGRFFLTSCMWQSQFVIRTCLLGFRTQKDDLEDLMTLIRSTLNKV
jgi:aromatic-L-amino-acid decarboxylase